MAWYSSPPLAYSIYLPMALASTALPYALTQHTSERALPRPRALQSALLGYALVISLVAGLSVALGMGSGYLFAAWGLCALLAAGFVTLVCSTPPPTPPLPLRPPLCPVILWNGDWLPLWGLCALLAVLCCAAAHFQPHSQPLSSPSLAIISIYHHRG